MKRAMMKSKIHRAVVTESKLHYEGSITIDRELMDFADLRPYERVHVFNIDNGARFETYVIEGARASGDIHLNGAAARLGEPGDKVIIVSFATYDESELEDFVPKIVTVDEANRPTSQMKPPARRSRGAGLREAGTERSARRSRTVMG